MFHFAHNICSRSFLQLCVFTRWLHSKWINIEWLTWWFCPEFCNEMDVVRKLHNGNGIYFNVNEMAYILMFFVEGPSCNLQFNETKSRKSTAKAKCDQVMLMMQNLPLVWNNYSLCWLRWDCISGTKRTMFIYVCFNWYFLSGHSLFVPPTL